MSTREDSGVSLASVTDAPTAIRSAESRRWLQIFKPRPNAALRLFCLPFAGGGPPVFRTWSKLLPATVEVCPVQLPGRGARIRETPINRVPDLIRALTDALLIEFDRPYAVFGHSFGAILGFELLRELRRRRAPAPVALIASASNAPHLIRLPRSLRSPTDEVLVDQLSELNGTPSGVLQDPELMQMVLPAIRSDLEALAVYDCAREKALGCPITVFGGLRDSVVRYETLANWREHTVGSFAVHPVPGDHFFLESNRALFLSMLSSELGGHVARLAEQKP